jgi:membrane protein DedA with SNARE-associated domain
VDGESPQGSMMAYEQMLALGGPYLGVFLVLMACGWGLPLPEDVPLLTSGFLVHKGMASLTFMIPVAMAGVLGGDCSLFFLGRRFGHHAVEHRFFRRVVKPARLLMAERLFQKHGIKIIFVGRYLPGLRSMIFMAAGVLKVPFTTFIAVNGLAACVSVPTLVILGKVFGSNFDKIKSEVREVTHFIVLAVLLVALAGLGLYLHRRQKRLIADAGLNGKIDAETLAQMPPQADLSADPPAAEADAPPEKLD